MMPDEKERLLALFDTEARWCRGAEAANTTGRAVSYDDGDAVAWDLTGALCVLFGWPRACVLFGQLDRHLHGRRAPLSWPARSSEMDAMSALQEFNDRPETTFETLRARLEAVPVWRATAGAVEGA